MIINSGALRGDKVTYPDGVGCSIWYPFPDMDDTGICFDFPESDIDDIIKLLQALKNSDPEPLEKGG
jgi:hypothetical protein